MSLPPLATIDDLETRSAGPVADPAQAEWMLAQASAIVRAYAGRTWVDVDGELSDVPDGVPGVVVEMVFRVTQNPEGVTQDTTGPFSVSFGTNAAERLYLSTGDKVILGPLRTAGGLGRIGTTRGPVEMPSAPAWDIV